MPRPRLSTHKPRASFFNSRASYPGREAYYEYGTSSSSNGWTELGPFASGPGLICGGRVTCASVDPTNSQEIIAGSAAGGLWLTEDQGRNWRSLWREQETLNIGALARAPRDPSIVYCGTGEANLSSDNYPGAGVYKSQDRGRTWFLAAHASDQRIPRRIGTIAVDPSDSNHLILGGVRHSDEDEAGVFVSTDAGSTWSRIPVLPARNSYRCHAVVFHPKRKHVVFITLDAMGSWNGIWRSDDGGANWTHLLTGLPDACYFGRASLAIAPSAPDTVYAIADDRREGLLGVFRSCDLGKSWNQIAHGAMMGEGQMSYNNCIVVHPERPDLVICGGVNLYRTTDAGRHWRRITDGATPDTPSYSHPDHHALLMPEGDLLINANDGGVFVSNDAGTHWEERTNGLAIAMFYDVDVAPTNPEYYGGGVQDNGTLIHQTGDAPGAFMRVLSNDGGWMVFDPENEEQLVASSQFINVSRLRKGRWKVISPPVTDAERDATWMSFIAISSPNPGNIRRLALGSTRLWLSEDAGNTWEAVTADLDGTVISAVEIAGADPDRIYIGTSKGGIFRSTDGGVTWSENLASVALPGVSITRLESHSEDANIVAATVGGGMRTPRPGRFSKMSQQFDAPYPPNKQSHVFLSHDGGLTWNDIDNGRLPAAPHHAAAFESKKPFRLFVGSDGGVWMTPDLGQTWENVTGDLPNVMVSDIVYHAASSTITAATYGRGLWRLKV